MEFEAQTDAGSQGRSETLADTINEMIDTLATFADQKLRSSWSGSGKLGGQAKVPVQLVLGRFDVNELAATLTTRLRAIASVATAVTKDLTGDRSQAQGR